MPRVVADSAEDMHRVGRALASLFTAGDVVILEGPLGAGKTTLTQGIAAGMGVDAIVTSPTFVLSQTYQAEPLNLIHVDAYRLESESDTYDLDLEDWLGDSVVVAEWGDGKLGYLVEEPIRVTIDRDSCGGEGADGARVLHITGPSDRWSTSAVEAACAATA